LKVAEPVEVLAVVSVLVVGKSAAVRLYHLAQDWIVCVRKILQHLLPLHGL